MQHMTDWRAIWRRQAPPRTHADAKFLAKYSRYSQPAIVAAAVLPLVVDPGRHQALGIIIGVGSWLVFVADFVIQVRRREHYTKTGMGLFDLAIVILTSPWYLIPGVNAGAIVTILRLARLARIVMVFHGARRLLERLGKAALLAIAVVLVFSWVAYDAEHEVNREFASYGDSLWWGIVTLTTVGYGDIVPITVVGRYAGVMIMVMGVGLLGVLAGALASFFKLSPKQEQQDEAAAEAERKREFATENDPTAEDEVDPTASAVALSDAPSGSGATSDSDAAAGTVAASTAAASTAAADPTGDPGSVPTSADIAALTQQVVDLRHQIADLTSQLGRVDPHGSGAGAPAASPDSQP